MSTTPPPVPPQAPAAAEPAAARRDRPAGLLRRIWADPGGRIGLVLTVTLALAGLGAVLGLAPHDPVAQAPAERLTGPSAAHWLGTDQFGRDVLSRTLVGIATSLRVVVVAVGLAGTLGTLVGVTAGYFGGVTDQVVGRLTDVLFAFPAILLALTFIAGLGPGWGNTAVAIAIVYFPIFVRVARGPTLSVRASEYVQGGRVLGFSAPRLLLRHVLPNVSAPVTVQFALAMSWAILTESALSFLGLGTQPPDPSLGLMVSEARNLLTTAPWTLTAPAVAVVLAVVGFNLLGDGLRAALDPRSAR